jgi:iron complex outermembrane receptor protein
MRKSAYLMSVASMTLAAPAFGQAVPPRPNQAPAATQDTATSSAAQDDGNAQDIVITATQRSERLSDVPIAVSAVSQEALQNSGANDIRALGQLAPSLLVSSTGSEANASARIRGIGTVGDNPGLESSVAVFIDGVYRSGPARASTTSARSTGSRCCAGPRARCSAATPRPA